MDPAVSQENCFAQAVFNFKQQKLQTDMEMSGPCKDSLCTDLL